MRLPGGGSPRLRGEVFGGSAQDPGEPHQLDSSLAPQGPLRVKQDPHRSNEDLAARGEILPGPPGRPPGSGNLVDHLRRDQAVEPAPLPLGRL